MKNSFESKKKIILFDIEKFQKKNEAKWIFCKNLKISESSLKSYFSIDEPV